jgi:hypothetical protein
MAFSFPCEICLPGEKPGNGLFANLPQNTSPVLESSGSAQLLPALSGGKTYNR